MSYQTISKIASLVMALVMMLGNTIPTQAQTTGATIYWGAMVGGVVPSSANMQTVFATFEAHSGKRMSLIHWGQPWVLRDGNWGEFQTDVFDTVRNHGSIPMINWGSWWLGYGANQPDFQSRDIYGGRYDAYITRWATDAKNWGHPFFLRFDHEMNGWWYPWGEGKRGDGTMNNGNSTGDFVKAWRHVHDIFTSVGATNVTWVWTVNHMSKTSQYPALSTLYPGDAYVDWTGFTTYNKNAVWAGLKPLLIGSDGLWMRDAYDEVATVAPSKPMVLAEFASIEAGDGGAKKAAWITDALTVQIPTNFPRIKAIVWTNWDVEGRTYSIESSQAATNAWAAAIGLPMYAANEYAGLNTSPIPALQSSSLTGTSTSLIAVADSYIDSTNPASTAGGTGAKLYVRSSPVKTTFMKFDLTPLAGKTITSVVLKFKTTSDTSAGSVDSANVKFVSEVQWREQSLSFNNSVPISATVLGTVPANTAPNTWIQVPLTASVIQERVGGLLSLAIESSSADALILYSRESMTRPQLIVTYR